MKGKELLEFLQGLTSEQLELPVLFDTCAKKYDYHYAEIGSAHCDDDEDLGSLKNINLHEKRKI